jgi:hypothetical protein
MFDCAYHTTSAYAKQPLQAQVEAVHKFSILYDIYMKPSSKVLS